MIYKVIYLIIQKNDTEIKNQIYHFSNEGVCSWYDFAVAINEAFGHNCKVLPCHSDEFPSKVTRPSFSVLDKTKIKKALDIEVPYWRKSIENCLKILYSNIGRNYNHISTVQNNKRIAKNTVFLYLRMFITMGVSLFTSRVVLNTLGVEDFGIYNVVGYGNDVFNSEHLNGYAIAFHEF